MNIADIRRIPGARVTVLSHKTLSAPETPPVPASKRAAAPPTPLGPAVDLGGGDKFACGETVGSCSGSAVCFEAGGRRALSLINVDHRADAGRQMKLLGDVNGGAAQMRCLSGTFSLPPGTPGHSADCTMTACLVTQPPSGEAMRYISLEGFSEAQVVEMIASYRALLEKLVAKFHAMPFYANYSPVFDVESGREVETFLSFFDNLGYDVHAWRFYLFSARDLIGFPADVAHVYAEQIPGAVEDFERFIRWKHRSDNGRETR